MKIAIESQRIFRSHKHGMDVVAVEMIRQLQEIDKTNEYLLFAKDGPDRNCVQPTSNFNIKILRSLTYGDWEQVFLPAALKKARPDLIHCTANTAPVICPVPLVLTLHDIIYLRETNFKGSAYQNFGNIYRRFIVPPAINRAKKIITVSEEEKRIIADVCNVEPSRIVVIHNAVHEKFNTGYNEEIKFAFRNKYQLPEHFILHLGNTAPKKNTAKLIEVYAKYHANANNALPLVIADYPRQLVLSRLEELRRTDLLKHIFLPGYISSLEMPLMYASASIFVYPSLIESFGIPLLEAMASGTPVVASDLTALREVGDDAAVFTTPNNADAIAEAISTLLNDTAMRENYIARGIDRAKMFTWRKSAEKLLALYSAIGSS